MKVFVEVVYINKLYFIKKVNFGDVDSIFLHLHLQEFQQVYHLYRI